MDLLTRIDFSTLLPEDEKHDLSHYFNGISRHTLIKTLVLLAEVSDIDSSWRNWDTLIYKKWFQVGNIEFANRIRARIRLLENTATDQLVNPNFILLNEIASLKFTEYVLSRDIQLTEDEIDMLEIERNILKALLIINEELNQKDLIATTTSTLTNNGADHPDLMALNITYGMAQYELVNTGRIKLMYIFISQLIKSIYLFDFLAKENQPLLNEFLSNFNCLDYKDYLNRLLPIIISVFNSMDNPHTTFEPTYTIIDVNHDEIEAIKFIEVLLVTPGLINEDIDFRHLRNSPLVAYKENSYAVINKLFIVQKLYNSLYFLLKGFNDTLAHGKQDDFRGYYTFHFTEKYLLYTILNNIYGFRSYIQFSGERIENEFNFKGGSDYYIRNGNKIFLFENKDNFINANDKGSYDFREIKKSLDSKLVNKYGIPQLINNIRFCLNKNYTFDQKYNPKTCKIYPIIVIHRAEFDVPGLNKYIQDQFVNKLNILQTEGFQTKNISPLTIINIDTLIIYQKALISKSLILEDIIDDYHSSKSKNITRAQNATDFQRKVSRSFDSFSDFVWLEYAEKKRVFFKYQIKYWVDTYVKKSLF